MSKHAVSPLRVGRLRFTPIAIATGLAAALALSLSLTGTMSAFTASIRNDTNTLSTGTITMQETSGSTTCNSNDGTSASVATNTFTCSTINKFGGTTGVVPNQTITTNLSFKNSGSAKASTFTLLGGTCAQGTVSSANGGATDLCSKLNVSLTANGTAVTGLTTLAALAGTTVTIPGGAAANTTVPLVLTVTLDSSAANTYQGLTASMPLTWTFSS
ncbi:hypothetical protein [Curtobacterium sp. Leaf261]|uniref:hypothetical protein n=1 Tax=Curtobacterium sp. Leaf261 TaxID=1736311 RepID=UPI0006F2EBBD|nr:hypothetical protein [Curtobacterium sp. Leaf261]KQO65048.1 hypothetical protein ASF23_02610 [Curtobacterium sp. Leaf261]